MYSYVHFPHVQVKVPRQQHHNARNVCVHGPRGSEAQAVSCINDILHQADKDKAKDKARPPPPPPPLWRLNTHLNQTNAHRQPLYNVTVLFIGSLCKKGNVSFSSLTSEEKNLLDQFWQSYIKKVLSGTFTLHYK